MSTGNTPMTPGQIIQAGIAVAGTAAPFLPPNIALGLTIVAQITQQIQAAMAAGSDVPDEALDKALDADAAARVLEMAAEERAQAREAG